MFHKDVSLCKKKKTKISMMLGWKNSIEGINTSFCITCFLWDQMVKTIGVTVFVSSVCRLKLNWSAAFTIIYFNHIQCEMVWDQARKWLHDKLHEHYSQN